LWAIIVADEAGGGAPAVARGATRSLEGGAGQPSVLPGHDQDRLVAISCGDHIVTGWGTAIKASEMNDYSAGTVLTRAREFGLLPSRRHPRALGVPLLKRRVAGAFREYGRSSSNRSVIIEDAGSGTAVIQELPAQGVRTIAFKPQGDKVVLMSAQTAKIEAGTCSCRQAALAGRIRDRSDGLPPEDP
jgi:predicted phage terminase large subunit-like protein